jgi:hypothetical protein
MTYHNVREMQCNAVQVLFLHPDEKDPLLNRITATMGKLTHGVQGTCHVELRMPYMGGFLTTSIYNGENVNLTMTKTFSNPGYHVNTLLVTDAQLHNMTQTVLNAHSRGDSFDALGMYLACLPVQIPRFKGRYSTFCSKYITEILQVGNIKEVYGLNPNITTPSRLLKLLAPVARNTMGSVDHKLRTFEKTALFSYTRI